MGHLSVPFLTHFAHVIQPELVLCGCGVLLALYPVSAVDEIRRRSLRMLAGM